MSRWERWCFNLANVLLAISGGAFFYMKYVLENEDPFALVNHPWQPAMLAFHVAIAPLGMVFFGIVFRSHILRKIASPDTRARVSGWASLLSFATMAASGYLLQILAQPSWLRAALVVHVASSIVFVLGYTGHLIAWLRATPGRRRAMLPERDPLYES